MFALILRRTTVSKSVVTFLYLGVELVITLIRYSKLVKYRVKNVGLVWGQLED